MKKVVGVIFTLLIIAGGILFAIKSGLLMKPSDKVFLAAANTIVDQGEMVKALKGLTILSEDEFTVNMTETNGEHNRTTQLSVTPDEKQLTQKIHYLVNLLLVQKEVDLQYTVSLDQQYVKIAIPEVTDKIIVYDYMEDLSDYCPRCGAQMDELVSKTDELNSSVKIPVMSMKDICRKIMCDR